uniref:Uncharacterized protein n=1 Tax=Vespula pensylvanica TaxID=30213 RepID=A0A834P6J3_VESPE|nr:hypothetical protein H0235_006398 [Vespula pensylvanica]
MPLDSAKEERIPLDGYAGDFETPQKETWNRIGSLRRHKEPAARIPKARNVCTSTARTLSILKCLVFRRHLIPRLLYVASIVCEPPLHPRR